MSLSAALLLGACLSGPPAADLSGQEPAGTPETAGEWGRVEGEYGLRVAWREGELHVGWLTGGAVPGVLEVYLDGEEIHRFETPAGQAHRAHFPRPDRGHVVLRYGTRGAGELHTTELPPDPGAHRYASVLTGVDSLFVVGDVHGEYDTLLRLLGNAGLIDAEGRWSGGRSHVAFLGDLFDRGPDVTRTLWFLYRLEREAAEAGGGAHVLLGNHETMVFTEDLRYVGPKEKLLASLHGTTYTRLFDIRESVLGRWLAARPALMQVDDVLLAHGGVSPEYAHYGVEEFNDSLRTFMSEDLFYYMGPVFDPQDTTAALVLDPELADRVRAEHVIVMDSAAAARRVDFFFDEQSVFWFRGYFSFETPADDLKGVLERYGARLHVVGHTPVRPIQARLEGRLIGVDLPDPATGMLLLVRRDDGGWERLRYGLEGPPVPVALMSRPPEVVPPDTMGVGRR